MTQSLSKSQINEVLGAGDTELAVFLGAFTEMKEVTTLTGHKTKHSDSRMGNTESEAEVHSNREPSTTFVGLPLIW